MAILNGGLLGTSRNKVGGIVTYRLKGQDVARQYVQTISNPRTDAQMLQRAKLVNLVAAYRANRFWMRSGAFETKSTRQSDYNAFVSANTSVPTVYMTREMAAAGAGIVLPYTVTRGSLPSINCYWDNNGTLVSDLYLGTDAPPSTEVSTISRLLIENNNGLRYGDQISIIVNYQRIANGTTPYILTRAYELILSSTDNRSIREVLPYTLIEDDGDQQVLEWEGADLGTLCAATFVLSRDTGGRIQVSTETLVPTSAMAAYAQQWQTPDAYTAYADSYGSTGDNFLSAGYSGSGSSIDVPLVLQVVGIGAGSGSAEAGGTAVPILANYQVVIALTSAPGTVTSVQLVTGAIDGSARRTTTITTGFDISADRVRIDPAQLTDIENEFIFGVSVVTPTTTATASFIPPSNTDSGDAGDVTP